MKCPKCSYTSFDYLEKCRKCGADLRDARNLIQIIAVPPEEKAPVYAKSTEPARLTADSVPAEASSLFANDFMADDFDTEPSPEQDVLAGLNFERSFDELVEPTAQAAADQTAPSVPEAAQDDGLLDLDFGDVFGEPEVEGKKK